MLEELGREHRAYGQVPERFVVGELADQRVSVLNDRKLHCRWLAVHVDDSQALRSHRRAQTDESWNELRVKLNSPQKKYNVR
jgi:hypothetical protein